MGLIKSAISAIEGTLADQWQEYFYCDSIDVDVLFTKAEKRISDRTSNTKGEKNVISNGAGIAVANGQCMIIVEQGEIIEICAEPGIFTYNSNISPSIFYGDLNISFLDVIKDAWKRFQLGGNVGRDQRIYYFNTKEIIGNKYGTAEPIPFRIIDKKIGLDMDIPIKCNGEYSYRIIDPILFYKNVCGNVKECYRREELDSQLKSELMIALQKSFAEIAKIGIRYNELPLHVDEVSENLKKFLLDKWVNLRGIEIVSFGINSVSISEEKEDYIQELQRMSMLKNPSMAAAVLVDAQAEAMKKAAENDNGALLGLMGMGFAAQTGGVSAERLFSLKQNVDSSQEDMWICSCGKENTGNFCSECGKKKLK